MTQPRQKLSVKYYECGHSKNGRNLVVCIDGTSNQFGDKNTNVIELYSLILKHIQANQKTWYNSGIGTYAPPSWKSLKHFKNVLYHKVDLAIAWDFERTVQGAYQWLSDNYEEGDCIFLFGFSRGAFQVRVLAGMIDKVGLIHKGNELQIPFAYEVYKDEETDIVAVHAGAGSGQAPMSKAERFKNTFSHTDVKVHFVGAWDTVSSIGVVRGKQMLPRTVDGMKHVCYFRHALALDERRVKFLPEYAYGGDTIDRAEQQRYQEREEEADGSSSASASSSTDSHHTTSTETETEPETEMHPHTKEVWFAGTHSDIGGGNFENPTLDRGRPPLRWMAFEAAAAGLRLRPFERELSLKEQVEVIESLTWVWKPLEYLPLKRLTFNDGEDAKATSHEPHVGGSRRIKHGQKIHTSVLLADPNVEYSPKAKPPDDVDAATFWYKLREGKKVFEEWVEEDMSHFMRQLVKSALAEHQSNQQLEDLLLPASTRGGQELYTTVIMALKHPELLQNLESKKHLLSSLMTILENTFWMNRLDLVPSGDVLPLLQDLMTIGDQEYQAVAKDFVKKFTDCSLQRIPAPDRVWGIAYSADGRWVAWGEDQSQSATASHIIRLWDARRGQPARTFEGHTEDISSVAFSRNGRFLASASEDRTVRIWDLEAENPAYMVFVGHTGPVKSVTFSPDGRYVVSGSVDHTLRIWDIATGHLKCSPLTWHKAQVLCVAVSPDGRYLASGSVDKSVRIWNLATGASKRAIDPLYYSVWAVAFSPDSRRVVVALANGSLTVWDVQWIRVTAIMPAVHTGPICTAVFSPDGEYIASGSYDRTVCIWNAKTGALVRSLKGHSERIFHLVYSPDGRYIYSGSDDGTVRVWDARVPKEVGNEPEEKEL